jgi:hypothetical protein
MSSRVLGRSEDEHVTAPYNPCAFLHRPILRHVDFELGFLLYNPLVTRRNSLEYSCKYFTKIVKVVAADIHDFFLYIERFFMLNLCVPVMV